MAARKQVGHEFAEEIKTENKATTSKNRFTFLLSFIANANSRAFERSFFSTINWKAMRKQSKKKRS